MAFLPAIISAGTAIYGAVKSGQASDAQKKAAQQAGQYTPVNLADVNQQVQQVSQQNAALSNQMEQQYNPYINQLRQTSAASLSPFLQPSAQDTALQSGYMNAFNQAAGGPQAANAALTNAATSANQQLALGGNLGQELQNQIMRAGAAKSGALAGPGGGLGMGRDISARDLGLTSLQLLQQRQNAAASIGSTASNYGLQALAQQQSAMQGYGGAANTLEQQQYNRDLALSQFTQGIQQPQVGLSPSSAAGILVGNTNMANSAAQNQAAIQAQLAQSQGQMGGQLLGYGLNAIAQKPNMFQPISNWFQGSGSGSLNSSANYTGDSAMWQQ